MNQQINLYQPMFRKQKKIFSAATMLQICLFFIFVFAGLYAYELYRMTPINEQVTNLKGELQELTAQLNKLKKQQPARAKSVLLDKEIARVTRELEQIRHIQQILSGKALGNTSGFSGHLEAFARQRVEGAWLTRFAITGGGTALVLQGNTLASELVPVYIQQLANEKALSGTSFNFMELKRSGDIEKLNQIAFTVSTR
ncbi:MAG: hypothetical protein A2W69_04805 [Gammaproteobacteria bacterium RIFCSPLOWO2_02_47_7]|nr:MAG: hypothetical protein A2W69_04805 [Gammaproteobacteria bacterium RIFCSPLOWO2_02_47_7]